MQAGFCISEWAQTNSPATTADNFKRNVDGTSTAFRTDDLIFFSKGKKKINTMKSLVQLKNNKLVNLRWRFHKTQDNDQQLTYSSDKIPDLCFVKQQSISDDESPELSLMISAPLLLSCNMIPFQRNTSLLQINTYKHCYKKPLQ